jgi:hypothetical protein
VWRNRGTTGNWLEVDLLGDAPNTTAIGARIVCHARIGGGTVSQSRWVEGQTGYCGQVLRQHFGLGDATAVDSLVVFWPDGTTDSWIDLQVNAILTLEQGGHQSTMPDTRTGHLPDHIELESPFPNPFNGRIQVGWTQSTDTRVRLDLVDISGRQLVRIVDGYRAKGRHSIVLDASGLPSGLYFVNLTSRLSHETRKIVHFK